MVSLLARKGNELTSPRKMKLYKYTRSCPAKKLLTEGSLMLTNPTWFRDEAKLGTAIGDAEESVRRLKINTALNSNAPRKQFDDIRKTGFHITPKPNNATFLFVNCHSIRSYNDYYIYCLTTTCDPALLLEFGAEICLEVVDEARVAHCVSRQLGQDFAFRGWFECIYTDNPMPYDSPSTQIPPVVFKRSAYSHQREVRGVWQYKGMYAYPERRLVIDHMLATCFQSVPIYALSLQPHIGLR